MVILISSRIHQTHKFHTKHSNRTHTDHTDTCVQMVILGVEHMTNKPTHRQTDIHTHTDEQTHPLLPIGAAYRHGSVIPTLITNASDPNYLSTKIGEIKLTKDWAKYLFKRKEGDYKSKG